MAILIAPVIVFCYNRPNHLRETLHALKNNVLAKESDLFIFSDGARDQSEAIKVGEVRQVAKGITGFKSVTVIEAERNRGLADSVINGVSQILKSYDRVIVLEDDMQSTSDFLEFMNEALSVYLERDDIFSITGYSPPIRIPTEYKGDVYLSPRTSSWGWATWADRWAKADWVVEDFEAMRKNKSLRIKLTQGGDDLWPMMVKQYLGVISSWSVRWTWAQVKNDAFSVYPVRSKIRNTGTDGSGTNFTFASTAYGDALDETPLHPVPDVRVDDRLVGGFKNYYRLPFLLRLKNWFKYGI